MSADAALEAGNIIDEKKLLKFNAAFPECRDMEEIVRYLDEGVMLPVEKPNVVPNKVVKQAMKRIEVDNQFNIIIRKADINWK